MVLERSVVLPDGTTPVRLTVAADARLVGEPAAAFARTLASLAVLGLALLAAAVVQVEVGLRPLARLRRELAAVRRAAPAVRHPAVPIEVEPLTQDLNLLLEHSEAVLARARVQAGNLARAQGRSHRARQRGARASPRRTSSRRRRGSRRGSSGCAATSITTWRGHGPQPPGRAGQGTELLPSSLASNGRWSASHAERRLAIEVSLSDGLRFGGEREDLQEMLAT